MMDSGTVASSGVGVDESVTFTVKSDTPSVVGVPAICPVDASSVRPAGNEPESMDQELGATPPTEPSVAL